MVARIENNLSQSVQDAMRVAISVHGQQTRKHPVNGFYVPLVIGS